MRAPLGFEATTVGLLAVGLGVANPVPFPLLCLIGFDRCHDCLFVSCLPDQPQQSFLVWVEEPQAVLEDFGDHVELVSCLCGRVCPTECVDQVAPVDELPRRQPSC